MTRLLQDIRENLDLVDNMVRQTRKSSALVIQQFPVITDTQTLVPNVRESIANIIGFVELGDVSILSDILDMADGRVDAIIVDGDCKLPDSAGIVSCALGKVTKSKLFFYSDTETWAEAAFHFILGVEEFLVDKSVLLLGSGYLYNTLLRKFQLLVPGISTSLTEAGFDIVIGASYKQNCNTEDIDDYVRPGARIYDIGIGNFRREHLRRLFDKRAKIYRFDNRAGISSLVLAKLETDYLLNRVMGKTVIGNTPVIAGGIMGMYGDIVVDDIKNPRHVLGVADGAGYLKTEVYTDEEKLRLDLIRSIIK